MEAPYKRVVLTGFMGAGKTTVGRLLASRLAWRFCDADALLVEQTGRTIAELFSEHGESHFRQLEAAVVRELLHAEQVVIALGGGAVEDASTRMLLQATDETLVVYLELSLNISVERCHREQGGALRPVLADAEKLAERFNARQPFYQMARLTVPADQDPDAIAGILAAAAQGRRALPA